MNEMSPQISIDRDAGSAFCRRHHIQRLALFGSVRRDDFTPDSDDAPLTKLMRPMIRSVRLESTSDVSTSGLKAGHYGPTLR